ncbi:MAG: DUF2878 domain-containing protein, partial [Alphaproteobacteria bacterium]|nr:DUF2878 domain-containing protein [Alphaproteobacteria bacterium]
MGLPIKSLLNFTLFQLAWFAAITGGAAGYDGLAALPAVAVCLLHLGLNRLSWRGEAWLILGVTLLGLIVETAFISFGALHYAGSEAGLPLPPLWILALWAGLALTLNHSLAWLQSRLVLAALLGAVNSPLSYLAASRLGALNIVTESGAWFLGLSLSWAVALPLLLWLASHLKQI